jgi:hypothetical protein
VKFPLLLTAPLFFVSAVPAQLTMSVDQNPNMALAAGNPALQRESVALLEARQAVLLGADPATAAENYAAPAIRDGKLQVIIVCDDIAATVAACPAAGIEVVGTFDQDGLRNVTVRVDDPLQLDSIAGLGTTRMIFPERAVATMSGSVGEQVAVALQSSVARTNFGINGTGYRVGVISDSINDTRGGTILAGLLTGCTDQTSGDLPTSMRIIDAGPGGNTDEGNGMAQLIYDVAPGCNISFASAFTGYFTFATNIGLLHTDIVAPADVICDDVIYFDEPMYQDGPSPWPRRQPSQRAFRTSPARGTIPTTPTSPPTPTSMSPMMLLSPPPAMTSTISTPPLAWTRISK